MLSAVAECIQRTYQIDLKTYLFNKFITTIRLSNNLLTIVITNYKKGKQLVTHI